MAKRTTKKILVKSALPEPVPTVPEKGMVEVEGKLEIVHQVYHGEKNQRCRSCLYFHEPTTASMNQGLCRRNPPTVVEHVVKGVFPVVIPNDWCGEWKSKV